MKLTMMTKGAIKKLMFDRSHCPLHYRHINHLYTIPNIVGSIFQDHEHTCILSYFLFLLLDDYYYSILCYFSFFSNSFTVNVRIPIWITPSSLVTSNRDRDMDIIPISLLWCVVGYVETGSSAAEVMLLHITLRQSRVEFSLLTSVL
jgi:hypothetical protein